MIWRVLKLFTVTFIMIWIWNMDYISNHPVINNQKTSIIRKERVIIPKTTKKVTQAILAPSKPKRKVVERERKRETVKQYAKRKVTNKWGKRNWQAFNKIVQRESSWNPWAINPSSGACGLAQALPCSKMGLIAPKQQIDWMIRYIERRYGYATTALRFHYKMNWY